MTSRGPEAYDRGMTDISDILYGIRNTAGEAADELREAITVAQEVLDRLDRITDDAEDGAQLIAASDIEPNAIASVPERSGLVRKEDYDGLY